MLKNATVALGRELFCGPALFISTIVSVFRFEPEKTDRGHIRHTAGVLVFFGGEERSDGRIFLHPRAVLSGGLSLAVLMVRDKRGFLVVEMRAGIGP